MRWGVFEENERGRLVAERGQSLAPGRGARREETAEMEGVGGSRRREAGQHGGSPGMVRPDTLRDGLGHQVVARVRDQGVPASETRAFGRHPQLQEQVELARRSLCSWKLMVGLWMP